MTKNIFSKMSTLVQAGVRDQLKKLPSLPQRVAASKSRDSLRQQYETALQTQETWEGRIQALTAEALAWDEKADAALQAGQEAEARRAIEQATICKQRLAMLQSELDDQRRAAQELLLYITELEARQGEQNAAPPPNPQVSKLKVIDETPLQADDSQVEDDLAIRRSRLAK